MEILEDSRHHPNEARTQRFSEGTPDHDDQFSPFSCQLSRKNRNSGQNIRVGDWHWQLDLKGHSADQGHKVIDR